MYERPVVDAVLRLIRQGPPLLQVVVGARQVGKTTAAGQVVERLGIPHVSAAADSPLPPGPEWIETQWARARALAKDPASPAVLVLDEIQKVRGWSELVKRLWDEDRRRNRTLHVLLLGSSALLLQHGLTESLAGRFFLHRCSHWSWGESREAFGWGLDRWVYFGGYPGTAPLVDRPDAWRQYVTDALIETVLARDVLQLQPVAKPALLRHLFVLSTAFPAQILSYNKMLGQLQDAGNTTTLAHYLKLLETAFLVSGLELFARGLQPKRGSSPKLVLWNQALINALASRPFETARLDPEWWGRLIENAVGAHLLNHLVAPEWKIMYWRRGDAEVDYVVERGRTVWGLEVKSGRPRPASGFAAFRRAYPKAHALIIGSEGVPLEEFLASDPRPLLEGG